MVKKTIWGKPSLRAVGLRGAPLCNLGLRVNPATWEPMFTTQALRKREVNLIFKPLRYTR